MDILFLMNKDLIFVHQWIFIFLSIDIVKKRLSRLTVLPLKLTYFGKLFCSAFWAAIHKTPRWQLYIRMPKKKLESINYNELCENFFHLYIPLLYNHLELPINSRIRSKHGYKNYFIIFSLKELVVWKYQCSSNFVVGNIMFIFW